MKTRGLIDLTILCIATLLAPVWAAQSAGEKAAKRAQGLPGARSKMDALGMQDPARAIIAAAQRLDLTDQQKQQIRQIVSGHRAATQEAETANRDAMQKLFQLVGDGAKEADIRTAAGKVGTTVANLSVKRAAAVAELKAVLTAEQLTKLAEIKQEWKQARQQALEEQATQQAPPAKKDRPAGKRQGSGKKKGNQE